MSAPLPRALYRGHFRGCPLTGHERPTADGYTDVWWSARCSVLGCDGLGRFDSRFRAVVERNADRHVTVVHPHIAAGIAVRRWEIGFDPVRYAASCSGSSCAWTIIDSDERVRDAISATHLTYHDVVLGAGS